MSRHTLLFLAAVGLCACNPRKPLPVSKDMGPAVQVVDAAPRPYAGTPATKAAPPLAETEPNDDREHAQRIDPQKVIQGSLLPPTTSGAGKGDDDYFLWPAQPAAQTLRIEASGAPELSLEVLTETATLAVIDERGAGEGERLAGLSIRAGQSVWIRVRGRAKAEAATTSALGEYQLAVTATPASPDSEAEPNDTATDATPILGNDASGALSFRRDEDYFVLPLPTLPGRKVTAFPNAEGLREPAILRVELTSPSIQPALRVLLEPTIEPGRDGGVAAPRLLVDVSAGKGKEELRLRNLTLPAGTGRVFIGVRGLAFAKPPGESRYHLRALVETPLEGAETEPNDSCAASASPLTLASGTADIAGFLWPGDVDCYRVTGAAAQETTYEAKLSLPGGDCSAVLEWVSADGKPVGTKSVGKPSQSAKAADGKNTDGKNTELTITTGGDFFLRVLSRDRRSCFEAPYRLGVTSKEPGGGDKP